MEAGPDAAAGSARGAAETHPDATTGVASTAQSGAPLVPRFVAVMVALPVLLATLFTVADAKAHDIVSTQEYTAIDQVIRSQAGLAVCVIDGKSYDYGAVQDFLKRLNANSASLGEEARSELTLLINEVFDKRVETVSFDASERLQEAGARLAASGAGAFVINRLIGKQVFKKMAEKLAAKLGVSATAKIASVGLVAARL